MRRTITAASAHTMPQPSAPYYSSGSSGSGSGSGSSTRQRPYRADADADWARSITRPCAEHYWLPPRAPSPPAPMPAGSRSSPAWSSAPATPQWAMSGPRGRWHMQRSPTDRDEEDRWFETEAPRRVRLIGGAETEEWGRRPRAVSSSSSPSAQPFCDSRERGGGRGEERRGRKRREWDEWQDEQIVQSQPQPQPRQTSKMDEQLQAARTYIAQRKWAA